MSGFITLHRSLLEHPLLDKPELRGAWIDLLMMAAWKPTRHNVRGKIITVERGQLCITVRALAAKWGWSKSTVDRFLSRLKTETMIGTNSETGKLIITICNYGKYQDQRDKAGTEVGTNSGTKLGQSWDTKEQENKLTRDNSLRSLSSAGARETENAGADFDEPDEQGSPQGQACDGDESQPSTPPAKPKAKRASKPRSAPLPEGWQPKPFGHGSESQRVVDGWPPGHLKKQVEKFIAHHASKGSQFVNWQQAWSTWVLNSEDFSRGKAVGTNFGSQAGGGYSGGGEPDRRNHVQRIADQKLAQLARQPARADRRQPDRSASQGGLVAITARAAGE